MTTTRRLRSESIRKVAHAALAKRQAWKEFLPSLRGAAYLGMPIALYRMTLAAAAAAAPLSRARHTGWRLPLVGGEANGLLDILKTARGPLFLGISEGRISANLIAAIRAAEKAFGHLPKKYDIRLLEVPALHFSALWLRGDAKQSRFVVLSGESEHVAGADILPDVREALRLAASQHRAEPVRARKFAQAKTPLRRKRPKGAKARNVLASRRGAKAGKSKKRRRHPSS